MIFRVLVLILNYKYVLSLASQIENIRFFFIMLQKSSIYKNFKRTTIPSIKTININIYT